MGEWNSLFTSQKGDEESFPRLFYERSVNESEFQGFKCKKSVVKSFKYIGQEEIPVYSARVVRATEFVGYPSRRQIYFSLQGEVHN